MPSGRLRQRSASSLQASDDGCSQERGREDWPTLGIPLDLAPMEAKLVTELPKDAGWQFEPKWDGFRCLAFRAGDDVEIKAKSGKSLSRFFPEVLENLRPLAAEDIRAGRRTGHSRRRRAFLRCAANAAASRRRAGSPGFPTRHRQPSSSSIACCARRASPCLLEPFEERRAALEAFFEGIGEDAGLTITPFTRDLRKAKKWLNDRQVVGRRRRRQAPRPSLPGRASAPC